MIGLFKARLHIDSIIRKLFSDSPLNRTIFIGKICKINAKKYFFCISCLESTIIHQVRYDNMLAFSRQRNSRHTVIVTVVTATIASRLLSLLKRSFISQLNYSCRIFECYLDFFFIKSVIDILQYQDYF